MLMSFDTNLLLILVSTGFFAGFIDSIAGGGGLITLPTLLAVGIPPHLALGTNKLAGTFGTFRAALTFIKKRVFNPLLWKAAVIATFSGSLFGVLLAHILSADLLKKIIPVIIIGVAVYIACYRPPKVTVHHNDLKPRTKSSVITGSLLGFYDGFLGPGAGSFWTTAVMTLYKVDLLTASGVARFMNFVSNLAALITFMILQNVNYMVGLCMGIALMLGAYVGSHSAIRFGNRFIKPIFLSVVIVTALHMAWQQFL